MPLLFEAMPSDLARAYQAGAPDAYGLPPERARSEGAGNPCRHCLSHIPQGREMLILAYRPFPALQPYAETGPIFLCADPCARGGGGALPAILSSPDYILRGYDARHRIVYGTGGVIARDGIIARAEALLAKPGIASVHVRSARNNCFQCRIVRA
ncbi:MAG: DUF1203 domain-containing protein [Defluviimonas sp.]|uniref:DUF1203 domain-containing protein n=1 Tax=Albidovulum sp. TaxID=1872424 RepID=UPI001E07B448|nr:DUF1203 domain-containing protein [Paracoccaceae bacterium]MCC0064746.1 DUF1203 domain-containing protein [Defluviimonas sp.]